MTPRDAVQRFVGLLNVIEQNPDSSLDSLLKLDGDDKGGPSVVISDGTDSDDMTRFIL